jgi:pyrrolidone-carboxylate peptidase
LPSRLSSDAGLYVCNDFYFRLLDFVMDRKSGVRAAMFIHIPSSATLAPGAVREGILAVARDLPATSSAGAARHAAAAGGNRPPVLR